MWAFFQELGVIDADGRPTEHFGQPSWVYLQYRRRQARRAAGRGDPGRGATRDRGACASAASTSPKDTASRSGTSSPSSTAAFAALYDDAKKCLWAELPDAFAAALPGAVTVRTLSSDRTDYILHPPTGERLDSSGDAAIAELRDRRRGGCDVQIVISDGLNALALTDDGHLAPYLDRLHRSLGDAGFELAPEPIVVTGGRVRAGYRIGEILYGARGDAAARPAIVHLIGERPGSGHHAYSVVHHRGAGLGLGRTRPRRSQHHEGGVGHRRHGAPAGARGGGDGEDPERHSRGPERRSRVPTRVRFRATVPAAPSGATEIALTLRRKSHGPDHWRYAPATAAAAAAVPVKKKTNPLVWVLVGCLGLFVIGGIIFAAATFFIAKKAKDVLEDVAENPVKAAAEMMVRMNPDLELVSTDDEAETMTVRDKTTGKTSTLNWSDISEGKFSIETDGQTYTVDGTGAADGSISVQDESGQETMSFGAGAGEVPDWFPKYHNAVEINVLVNANQNGQQSTIWTFQTPDAVTDVLTFYETQLKGTGWEVTTSSSDVGGVANGSIEAKQGNGAKSLNLVLTKSGGEAAQAMATYTATGG